MISSSENKSTKPDPNYHNPKLPPTVKTKAPLFNPRFKLVRKIFLYAVLTIIVGLTGFVLYATWELPPMHAIENPQSDLSTQLISFDGKVLQKFYSHENRVSVPLSEISPHVVDALLATEDVRFYSHSGIDPKSFFSIILGYVRSGNFRGGSTIDMQLARNLFTEKVGEVSTIVRKLREFVVSSYLERRFTKEEILAAYLNTVNIYGDSYGIETTANRLFDKRAKELTIEEAALLVGMLKGQGVYNPFKYPERSIERRNTVIDQMAKYDMIDSKIMDIDSIKTIPLQLAEQGQEHVKGIAPYFREHVREWLKEWGKERGYNLYTDGLRVYTTLDSRMQSHAESAVKAHLKELQEIFDKEIKTDAPYISNPKMIDDLMKYSERYRLAKKKGKSDQEIEAEFRQKVDMVVFDWEGEKKVNWTPRDSIKYYAKFIESGVLSIDPTNGHVKAWVGGPNFKYFKYDHVAKGKRQVGSTFKPFVYGAAIENGKNPCDLMLNQPVYFDMPDGTRWSPKNSTGNIGGFMTLKGGLARSENIITARVMKEIRPKAVVEFANRMGIKTKLDEVPSLCLGTTDLSVFEMANAYATIANYGKKIEPLFVTRIEDRNGNVIEEFIPEEEVALSNERHAYTLIEMLKRVVDQGTGVRLRYKYNFKNEIGGKTGTTQNHSDGWFMGITPNLVTGVWVGWADRRMHFKSIKEGQGANMALPIFALYMDAVYKDENIGLPMEGFVPPTAYSVDMSCPDIVSAPQEIKKDEGPSDSDDFLDF